MRVKQRYLILFLSICSYPLLAQSPLADFSFNGNICLNQEVDFTNLSVNSSTYVWDFCHTDLNTVKNVSSAFTVSASNIPTSITAVYFQGSWFGFLSSRANNKIFRLDFGSSLENVPSITDLGNVGGILSGPQNIKLVYEGGLWYGLLINYTNSTLIRLSFAGGINAAPTAVSLGNLGSWLNLRGLDLVYDGSRWIAIVSNFSADKLSLINFGTSISNSPTASDVISILNGNIANPIGVKLIKDSGNWFGVVASHTSNKILRLSFGTDLFSTPTYDDIYNINAPTELTLLNEGGVYHLHVSTADGSIHHINFGTSMAASVGSLQNVNLGNFGLLGNAFGFDIVRSQSLWYGFSVNYSNGTVGRIKFEGSCPEITLATSTATNPTVQYSQPGNFYTELSAFSSTLDVSVKGQSLTVQNQQAPILSFTNDNNCVSSVINFTANETTGQTINSWSWDFGDGNTDNTNSPLVSHQYNSVGPRLVTLSVVGQNTCTSELIKSVSVFNSPVSDFSLPTGPTCTNQLLTFANTTTFDNGSTPAWKWFVNNVEVATTVDLDYSFATDQSQTVKLTASIPGCESEIVKVLTTLKVGPSVDFTYTNNCFGQPIKFINTSSGSSITARLWDFGDGATELVEDSPQHQYAIAGTYSVKLTMSNDQGCTNEKTINLIVNDQPLVDFSNSIAIENLPVTFTGEDLTLADDQVNQWSWDFNSMGELQGAVVTFLFPSAGLVPISLTGTTDQGCTFSFTKNILVDGSSAPTISISINSAACLEETLFIQNNTVNASDFLWDFCHEDLKSITGIDVFATIIDASVPEGIETVYDKGNYYTFLTSRNNNKLFRLRSDGDLNSPAISEIVDLVAINLSSPMDIRLAKENDVWFAFVINSGSGKITRFRFGNGLENGPDQSSDLGNFGKLVSGIRGFDLTFDGTNWLGIVVNGVNNKINVINLGPSLASALTTDATEFNSSLIQSPIGVSLAKDINGWKAFVTSFTNNSIVRIDFGNDLSTVPALTAISEVYTVTHPFEISVVKEGLNFFGYVITENGSLHFLDFGKDISGVIQGATDKGTFNGVFGSPSAIEIIRTAPNWKGFVVDYANKKMIKLSFSSMCSYVSTQISTESEPSNVAFTEGGDFEIELSARHQNGTLISEKKIVTVSTMQAPSISFNTDTNCITAPTEFSAQNQGSIVDNYLWDFADNATYSSPSPTAIHQYSLAGEYKVNLQVHAQNGCNNFTVKNINIFNPPVSSFTLPSIGGNPICSNQLYNFINTTSFDIGSAPSWEWSVNGEVVSYEEDLEYAYSSSTDQIVTLKSSLLGCSNSETQTISNIQEGPVSDFLIAGICQDSPTTFTNASIGQIDSFTWDLGDSSPLQTTIHVNYSYAAIGTYLVKLIANASNGCNNFTQKEIIIRSKPQPDFSLDLPPFSCSGSPSQFNDLTPAPTDSNISSWNWSFGDTTNGASTIKNPTYTYPLAGSYDVSLKATTNFGCEATKLKTIQIADPPKAAFTTSATCLNQATNFIDASTGTNKAWLWKIGNSSYTLQNPAHVFSNTGNYTAQLTVTGNNDCISVLSKPINVPIPPSLDFSVQNNCAGLVTIFEDITVQNADPAVSRVWDFGGKGSGSGASTQYSFSAPGSYNVKLTVTNQSGCTYALSKNTPIVVAPVANFTTSVESGPPPLDVQFTNGSSNATAFKWDFNDANNSTSTVVSPTFIYTSLGDFIVDLSASNEQGCIDVESKIIHVIIPYTEIELEEFTLLHDVVTGSVRPVLTIKNNSNYTISSINVVLDIAGNASVKEKVNATILPNASSSQILNYELLPGGSQLDYLCAEVQLDNDADLVNNGECISLESDEIVFSPYPNPVQEQLSVDWIASAVDPVKITVITQTGQTAYQKEVENVGVGLNQIILDFSKLNSGFYILIFEGSKIKKTFPIVIQN